MWGTWCFDFDHQIMERVNRTITGVDSTFDRLMVRSSRQNENPPYCLIHM
jgi:hypothetical protein